ncbi:MAG: exodeoxyribonuclease III [Sandaracinaceae bacterium]|nr:exodeoxyribonuclease III [Sandaracinaceae bacterium]
MPSTVVTWNVNSIKVRKERVLAFLARHSPDVVCLQELKLEEAKFPRAEIEAAGYHAAVLGQKTYNGVAILSKSPIENVHRGFADDVDDSHARFIIGTTAGMRIASAYFPNGGEQTSPKYPFKLAWMKRLRVYLDTHEKPNDDLLLCGDFNVAVDELDIAKPDQWQDTVLTSDAVRAALDEIREWGFVDAFRQQHPEGKIFSWWDYRQLAFPKNDGLRIDHIYATKGLAKRCIAAAVDREERKGAQPSDHAPVLCTFS